MCLPAPWGARPRLAPRFLGVAALLASAGVAQGAQGNGVVWEPINMEYRTIIGLVITFVIASMSNAAGIGGGAIFVPLFNLVVGFTLKESTAVSQTLVTSGALASVLLNAFKRRPYNPDLPLIDVQLALTIVPVLLSSLTLGVLLNVMLPAWAVAILLVLTLLYFSHRTVTKGVAMWKAETVARRARRGLSAASAHRAATEDRVGGVASGGSPGRHDGHDGRDAEGPQCRSCGVGFDGGSGTTTALLLTPRGGTAPSHAPPFQGRGLGGQGQQEGRQADTGRPAPEGSSSSRQLLGGDRGQMGAEGVAPSEGHDLTRDPAGASEGDGVGAHASAVSPYDHESLLAAAANGGDAEAGAGAGFRAGTRQSVPDRDMRRGSGDNVGTSKRPLLRRELWVCCAACGWAGEHGGAFEGAAGDGRDSGAASDKHSRMLARLRRLPPLPLLWMVGLWCIYLALSTVKALSAKCSPTFWAMVAVQAVAGTALSVLFAARALAQRKPSGVDEERGCSCIGAGPGSSMSLSGSDLTRLLVATGVFGVVAGIVGMGGGMVISPVMISMGVLPQITAATSALVVLFSSSSAVVQFFLLGRIPVYYALAFGGVCICASLMGVVVVGRLVKRSGRPSIIALILAGLIVTCTAVFIVLGAMNIAADFKSGDIGLHSVCV